MVDSVAEEVGHGRVDGEVVDDIVGPSTTKVVNGAISAEPNLKLPSGWGKYVGPSLSSLSHTDRTYLEQLSQIVHGYLVDKSSWLCSFRRKVTRFNTWEAIANVVEFLIMTLSYCSCDPRAHRVSLNYGAAESWLQCFFFMIALFWHRVEQVTDMEDKEMYYSSKHTTSLLLKHIIKPIDPIPNWSYHLHQLPQFNMWPFGVGLLGTHTFLDTV